MERRYITHAEAERLGQEYASRFDLEFALAGLVDLIATAEYYLVADDDPRAGTVEPVPPS